MDVPAKFQIYKGPICKVFKFNRNLLVNILNLSRTYLQTFLIYQGPTCKIFKFIRHLLVKLLNLTVPTYKFFKFSRDLSANFLNISGTYLQSF